MSETYEIKCGSRRLMLRDASTSQHAVVDYLRSLGVATPSSFGSRPTASRGVAPCITAVRLPNSAAMGNGIVGDGREEVTRCPGSWCC